MFLLILYARWNKAIEPVALHSTMFLLIRKSNSLNAFLFHTLHSTMFLLILLREASCKKGEATLHSTMFLLIQSGGCMGNMDISGFTFHYVSINTQRFFSRLLPFLSFTFHYVSINTGRGIGLFLSQIDLYIPLCFY